jgi:hypothetical protein
MFSPIEVGPDQYLLSASARLKNAKERATKFDVYSLGDGPHLKQLTEYGLYQLSAFSLYKSQLFFQASPYGNASVAPGFAKTPQQGFERDSEIFVLRYDHTKRQIVRPDTPLTPKFVDLITGFSTMPTVDLDGNAAFLNRRGEGGVHRFNIAVVSAAGKLLNYIKASDIAFSRPAFVARKLLANDLLKDRYVVREFDLDSADARVIFELPHSDRSLDSLERVSLKIQ